MKIKQKQTQYDLFLVSKGPACSSCRLFRYHYRIDGHNVRFVELVCRSSAGGDSCYNRTRTERATAAKSTAGSGGTTEPVSTAFSAARERFSAVSATSAEQSATTFSTGGDFQQNQQPKPYQQQGQQPQMNQMQPFSMPSDGVKFDQKNGDGGGQGMQQGQMQGNNNQNQGPSDEDRQKQDEQMEKRRLEMEKQGLTQMKRGMKQAATGVKRMKKDFEKFAKRKLISRKSVQMRCSKSRE